MRSLAIALSCLPLSSAFTPVVNRYAFRSTNTPQVSTNLLMASDNGNNHIVEQTKNGLFSLLTASAIIFSSIGVDIVDVEPANAVAPSKQITTTTSSKPETTRAVVAPDPLASQKVSVEKAKTKVASTAAATTESKKSLSVAQASYAKAAEQTKQLSKKAVSSKKNLISLNDNLADAKAKEGRNGGNLNSLKEVEKMATKVGEARDSLKTIETELTTAKAKETSLRKALSTAELSFDKASKTEAAAKLEASKASDTLSKDTKKAAKKAKIAKATKAKQQLEKKQKKKATE